MPSHPTESQGFLQLNIFEPNDDLTTYHGAPCDVRVVHRSSGGRHITFYGALPGGVTFTEHPAAVEETFYIVEGSIVCRPEGGEPIEWKAGDLVYWPYDRTMELEYSVGLRCICFFWSDEPLPDFTGGR